MWPAHQDFFSTGLTAADKQPSNVITPANEKLITADLETPEADGYATKNQANLDLNNTNSLFTGS